MIKASSHRDRLSAPLQLSAVSSDRNVACIDSPPYGAPVKGEASVDPCTFDRG